MTTDELRQIAAELRANGSDTHFVEAKRAQRQIPKRLRETLSAFANTSGGGVIVLGLDGESGFEITGVEEAGKLCQDLASLCGEMQPPVRALIQTHELKGKQVVTAEVPEADLQQKPCYYSGAGMNNGSFIRVGDGNRQLTHYEVAMFLASRGQPREDEQPVEGATLADLDPHFVTSFLGRLRASGSAFQDLSDEETLKRSKIMVNKSGDWMPSLAGLFALGRNPQQFFPSLCATLVVYPAEKVGEPGPNGERFLDNVRLDGPLPLMARAALLALQRNMKRRAIVRGLFREDTWEYPVTALREAVVNALVHRDYSTMSQGTPVQIAVFPDRLVISNPGGLYGPVTIESLGDPGVSTARNQVLMRILEDVVLPGENSAICENRGSGMGAMLAALRAAGMSPPTFNNRISQFVVTLPNHTLLDEPALRWLESIGTDDLTDSQRMALAAMRGDEGMTNQRYRQITNLDSRIATRELGTLVERKVIRTVGTGRWTTYHLVPTPVKTSPSIHARESELVKLLHEHGEMSRAELAANLKWKPGITSHWLRQLIQKNLVKPTTQTARSPHTRYRLNA